MNAATQLHREFTSRRDMMAKRDDFVPAADCLGDCSCHGMHLRVPAADMLAQHSYCVDVVFDSRALVRTANAFDLSLDSGQTLDEVRAADVETWVVRCLAFRSSQSQGAIGANDQLDLVGRC